MLLPLEDAVESPPSPPLKSDAAPGTFPARLNIGLYEEVATPEDGPPLVPPWLVLTRGEDWPDECVRPRPEKNIFKDRDVNKVMTKEEWN